MKPRILPLPAVALLLGLLLPACAGTQRPPLEAMDTPVDLERFMGDWYVLGAIPIDNFVASEAEAHNALENYRLDEKGRIQTTYTFRDGAFDGPLVRYTPVGFIHDEQTRAEWRMRFVWPFKSAYLIFHLEPDYRFTLIGVPDRSYVWIMGREAEVSDADYQRLVAIAADAGYSVETIRRIPHDWAEGELESRSAP